MTSPIPKSSSLFQFSLEEASPLYNVSSLRPGLYKVVRFKSTAPRYARLRQEKVEGFKHSQKLAQSISRSRRLVLELALCNEWKWFVTFTIDGAKEDRGDLGKFYNHFKEWLRYQREKYNKDIPYLLVPEKHEDGNWHIHGLLNADIDDFLVSFAELDQTGFRMLSGKRLPRKLIRGGYFDWPAYRKRFGFCSFGKIRDKIRVAFYVSKYITKSLVVNNDRLGARSFYASEGLNKAVLAGSVYANTPFLDAALDHHYKFCSTGYISFEPDIGWDPVIDVIEERGEVLLFSDDFGEFGVLGESETLKRKTYDPLAAPPEEASAEVDLYYKATQIAIKEWYEAVSEGSARL